MLLSTRCIWYSGMHTALGVVIKLLHFHLFCYLLVLHVFWSCFLHFFEFLLVFYFFHYFHSLLWFQSIYILLFQYCNFFCLLWLNFPFFSELRIKIIFTSALNKSLHMRFNEWSIYYIDNSRSWFEIFC